MRITKLITFLFQFITIGLAAAFVALYLFPSLLQKPASVEVGSTPPIPIVNTPVVQPILSAPVSYAHSVEIAAPAVVNVFTKKIVTERVPLLFKDPFFQRFFGDSFRVPRQRLESSLGSGVIVSAEGFILTNNHVIEGADEIEIALRDGRHTKAKVIGSDPETDVAVLRIRLKKLPVIILGQSEKLRVGDVVLAIGNPFGVGQTVTSGIVSATGRDMLGINTFENFIQTDAAINPGNSGGALVNPAGQLVGINTAIFSRSGGSQGIGFAIPVELAKGVMDQIIAHGRVIRGSLGIYIQTITQELADSFGLRPADGVIVTGVQINGPAHRAGIVSGDVLTHINGAKLKSVRGALNLISQVKPGKSIRIEGIRGGNHFSVAATVGERSIQK